MKRDENRRWKVVWNVFNDALQRPDSAAEAPMTTISKFATILLLQYAGHGRGTHRSSC